MQVLTEYLSIFFIFAALAFIFLAWRFHALERMMRGLRADLAVSMRAKEALKRELEESKAREIELQVALSKCLRGEK